VKRRRFFGLLGAVAAAPAVAKAAEPASPKPAGLVSPIALQMMRDGEIPYPDGFADGNLHAGRSLHIHAEKPRVVAIDRNAEAIYRGEDGGFSESDYVFKPGDSETVDFTIGDWVVWEDIE
jgi:hypothetical protein